MKRVLVTGSSGLVGSEAVRYFDALGYLVVGVDNNMRRDLFGPEGDTSWNLRRLKEDTSNFRHENVDIRSRRAIGLRHHRRPGKNSDGRTRGFSGSRRRRFGHEQSANLAFG